MQVTEFVYAWKVSSRSFYGQWLELRFLQLGIYGCEALRKHIFPARERIITRGAPFSGACGEIRGWSGVGALFNDQQAEESGLYAWKRFVLLAGKSESEDFEFGVGVRFDGDLHFLIECVQRGQEFGLARRVFFAFGDLLAK